MLWRKMLRELWEQKGTFISLSLIIASGISVYISMFMTLSSLTQAINNYYRDYNFGDVFAQVTSMPRNKATQLDSLYGIEQVTARLTKEVRVLFPGSTENVFVRLISYDANDQSALNLSHIITGPDLEQTTSGVYLTAEFAAANQLSPGDHLPILVAGRQQEILVVGLAQSPEYVYVVSGKSDIFPNPALFGVAMMPQEQMSRLFAASGEINNLSFRLAAGVTFDEIETTLKDELRPYGLLSLIPRKDQISNFMLNSEVEGLKATGSSIPVLLLLISTTILIITLRRRVEAQRGLIGVMLAFGYTRWEIMGHYLSYGLIVGCTGGVLGIGLGVVSLDMYVEMYQAFFSIPGFEAVVSPWDLFTSMAIALVCSVGACAYGCKDVLKLQPAEAMRPPAPVSGRKILLEKLPWCWNWLTMSGRMAMRNMARAPFRSIAGVLGVGLVFAMMAVVFSFNAIVDILMVDQYQKVETYDVKISFSQYQDDRRTNRELAAYPGVTLVETVLEIPGQLRNNNIIVDRSVIGLSEGALLFNLIDKKGNYIHPSGHGAVVSEELAKKLAVGPGSIIYLDAPMMKDPKPVVIERVVPQYLGSNLYLEKEALWQLLGQGQLISSAMLLAPPETVDALKTDYRLSDNIRSISKPDDTFAMVDEYMGSLNFMLLFMALSVGLIGFIIVYNSAMISFAERSRELASLSVLGLYDKEVAEVISFEQWILAFAGMVVGIPLTYLFCWSIAATMQNDVYSMPMIVPYSTLVWSFIITCAYLMIAQWRIEKKIQSLQIVEVLKERE